MASSIAHDCSNQIYVGCIVDVIETCNPKRIKMETKFVKAPGRRLYQTGHPASNYDSLQFSMFSLLMLYYMQAAANYLHYIPKRWGYLG